MRTMPPSTIVLLLEARLGLAAEGIVPVFRIRPTLPCGRISIFPAIFLSTGPAPGFPASLPHVEFVLVIESAGKDVVTRRIL